MKKVKVMLTAVTVLAVVGGALAFKSNKLSKQTVFITNGIGGDCTVSTNIYTTTSVGGSAILYSTESGVCPATPTFNLTTQEAGL